MSGAAPDISVIMGVYNQWDTESLNAAVLSIVNQTFKEWEFIIYDDGSDPWAAVALQKLGKLDKRIRLIGREENHGLAFSLNACIRQARGSYIARMDADDISAPVRLQTQYDFLEKHPEYGWCGCGAKLFDENGVWGERMMKTEPSKKDFLPFSPFIHPTVMYRGDLLREQGGYEVSKDTLRCEDYEIFMRLYQQGMRGYNLPFSLFYYREDRHSYKRRRFRYRVKEAKVRCRCFAGMHILFPKGIFYVIRPIVGGMLPTPVVSWIKHHEAGYSNGTKRNVQPTGFVSEAFTEKSQLDGGAFRRGETVG